MRARSIVAQAVPAVGLIILLLFFLKQTSYVSTAVVSPHSEPDVAQAPPHRPAPLSDEEADDAPPAATTPVRSPPPTLDEETQPAIPSAVVPGHNTYETTNEESEHRFPASSIPAPAHGSHHSADEDLPQLDSLGATAPRVRECPDFMSSSRQKHEPLSSGHYKLSAQRPPPECRSFNSSAAEDVITRYKSIIKDPDLYRLFENTFPNTIDTAIKWRGVSADNDQEELAFVITGDIEAMWLRDSADQIQAFRSLLNPGSFATDEIASLFRGVINLQARYIIAEPFCNAFLPPVESGIHASTGNSGCSVTPHYDASVVFTCNFELDSLAGFLQLSTDYFIGTGDVEFFAKFNWIKAVQMILKTAETMMQGSYAEDGSVLMEPYTFSCPTHSFTGTLGNGGRANPVNRTGLVRSPFRPSDDSGIFQFLIPANMMFAQYLETCSKIMAKLSDAPEGLSEEMSDMATSIKEAIDQYAIFPGPTGDIYAYEVDGFGGRIFMDDANIPSLLAAPFFGYLDKDDKLYQNTRDFVLSSRNPWYATGKVISTVGSPHIKPGAAWPMAKIVELLTTDHDDDIVAGLQQLVSSTNGLGLIHESVNVKTDGDWTRQWFSWANGLFGQMIVDLEKRKPHLLARSYQPE
ncbi:glycoside hydrolase family 125 protein [Myriangium duriaei CBS 260.36]|uniref:Glycoside hydrolase family 125 protein n=1 Tax=Myriangium duriaei CBS 260.36 TaxID=1168546 RepID=A0A9P4IWI0_9PEZI|nr:glycoside hydrolase family 125 protein [Myriangium duriaei CBS 260.36]